MEKIIQKMYEQAQLLNVCGVFTGKERTREDIADLLFSPQGIEFCVKNHFPNIYTFRQFKKYKLEDVGIYIDAGVITLNNPERVALIGKTTAVVNCDTLKSHNILLLCGAKVVVNAYKWSVVFVKSDHNCNIIRNVADNAIII